MSKNKSLLMTRRDALKWGIAGLAGMTGLSFLTASSKLLGQPMPRTGNTWPGKRKAKSIIQIWMWGGPSHLDTFDPKPDAGYDYTGPYNKPIETNVKGIRICQMLPLLAKHADKYAILRSVTHGINAHETASYLVQTGHKPGRLVYPSIGAVVNRFKGKDAGYKGAVPPYVVLTKSQGRFSEAGFLGLKYKPFVTGGDPSRRPFAVEGIITPGITDQRQRHRQRLLSDLDILGKSMINNPVFQEMDSAQKTAYKMMFGKAREIFDLTKEKKELREEYGMNKFGQSCLMARRLVEQGVPYITINYNGWDTHKMHFQIMQRKLPELDKGFSTLLKDLKDKGLLDNTIVWWTGEFGRSPKIQWEAPWNGGRGHHGKCFSVVVAGGGFKGGQVVGKSDAFGMEPVERPVAPQKILASMYHLMGIDPDQKLPNHRNIDTKIMPGAGLLKEII